MRRRLILLVLSSAAAAWSLPPARAAADDYRTTGKQDGAWGNGIPITLDEAARKRGRLRWSSTCAACHGQLGDGTQRSISLMDTRIRSLADGELFAIITDGRASMGPQGSFIPVDDRWKIVAHLRSLQKNAPP